MLLYDIAFNLVMAGFDLLLIWTLTGVWRRRGFGLRASAASLSFLALPLLLSRATSEIFDFRYFGTFRFLGMAAFWHLPILLLALGWIYRVHHILRICLVSGAVLILSLYVYAFHIEPHWLEVSHYTFTSTKLKGLERPITIAQVADFQTDHIGEYEIRVIKTLADLKPDMIVYNGDYVHTFTLESWAKLASQLHDLLMAAHLDPPFGSYAVIGDVDDERLWPMIFANQKVKMLNDEATVVQLPGCRVNLTGLRLKSSRATELEEIEKASKGREDGLLDLYIGHSPDFVELLGDRKEDFLALAGHTHGGQVRLPFYGPLMTLSRLPRKFADGFLPYGSGTLSVARGIGMERCDAPRLRFLCRPELRVVTLLPP